MPERHAAGTLDVLQHKLGVHVTYAGEPHQLVHDEIVQIIDRGYHHMEQELVVARHGPAGRHLVHAFYRCDEFFR